METIPGVLSPVRVKLAKAEVQNPDIGSSIQFEK
jgi:hypothetical protein